jgi:lysine 2,3-aminomutase
MNSLSYLNYNKYEVEEIKKSIPNSDWNDWHWQLRHKLTTLEDLKRCFHLTREEVEGVKLALSGKTLPLGISPYFASLMNPIDPKCPVRKQGIPIAKEGIIKASDMYDPLNEELDSPVPHLVHRYPDRVLLIANDNCATFCRYCTRRRIVGQLNEISLSELEPAFNYIRRKKRIHDVLISGGDPLTMSMRVDDELISMLKRYYPIWMSLHFTHPKEVTPEVKIACGKLADAGIPLGSQTVLLKGINDSPIIMKKLMQKLLTIRVRPYYLYQCDIAQGISHFRTSIKKGLEIIESLRGYTSGYANPTYVIDAPGGGGKIPVAPNYLLSYEHGTASMRNYKGEIYEYKEI